MSSKKKRCRGSWVFCVSVSLVWLLLVSQNQFFDPGIFRILPNLAILFFRGYLYRPSTTTPATYYHHQPSPTMKCLAAASLTLFHHVASQSTCPSDLTQISTISSSEWWMASSVQEWKVNQKDGWALEYLLLA